MEPFEVAFIRTKNTGRTRDNVWNGVLVQPLNAMATGHFPVKQREVGQMPITLHDIHPDPGNPGSLIKTEAKYACHDTARHSLSRFQKQNRTPDKLRDRSDLIFLGALASQQAP